MNMAETVTGECQPGFSPLVDLLASRIEDGTDQGCGVTVIVNGERVADLRAGFRNRQQTEPFGDPLLSIYSSGKAVLAALIMRAVSEGQLDYDQPISEIWPEFGDAGKENVTLAQALSHQAGVPGFVEKTDPAIWIDWKATCARIAAMPPLWSPGTANGYHPQTVGHIGGEVLRRATGKTVGEHLNELNIDIHCGMEASLQAKTAAMRKPSRAPDLGELDEITRAAFLQPWSSAAGVSREHWMAAEIPASNMHATSRGLAEIMQVFATGRFRNAPFVQADARRAATAERISGPDKVLPFHLSWAAGVMRNTSGYLGPNPNAVGHYGFGGSFVLADPDHGLSIAYTPNRMYAILVGGDRATHLITTVYNLLT